MELACRRACGDDGFTSGASRSAASDRNDNECSCPGIEFRPKQVDYPQKNQFEMHIQQ
jgi:hypothetical protein